MITFRFTWHHRAAGEESPFPVEKAHNVPPGNLWVNGADSNSSAYLITPDGVQEMTLSVFENRREFDALFLENVAARRRGVALWAVRQVQDLVRAAREAGLKYSNRVRHNIISAPVTATARGILNRARLANNLTTPYDIYREQLA